MKSSKLTARLLSMVLTVMMLFSLVTVGFTASAATVEVADTAADIEVAETGATISGGTYLYVKPNANWKSQNARFAAYFFGNGEAWVDAKQVETGIYRVQSPAGKNFTNVIFCRMNPGNKTNSWDTKWNQTSDLVWDGTKNLYTVKENTWDKGGGTWSVYADATLVSAPAAPAAATVSFTGTFGGTGTEADPYLVTPGEKTTMIVKGALGDANGLAYNVNYTATKVDWAVGATEILYSDLTAPALDETAAVNVYLWAYNAAGATKMYSETYATTTVYIKGFEQAVDPDVPVVDNKFSLGYQVVDGLYAYAAVVETKDELKTNAWQRWDQVGDTRYFYLPASASAEEVIILNTYSSQVMINGVIIPAGEYAVVPYTDGAKVSTSGATTQSVVISKTDAEGTLYINSADGMTTKNDAGVKATVDATYDLYAFMTSGSKNQEVGKATGAVASEANGVQEDTIVKKLKGRGNSTWNLSKKPFNITYEENIQIDNMKGKKWSLLANAQDSSLIRNRLVYDLANEVNMMYACDSRFVDFIVNGDYKGSYQLTQKIEMGKNTVMPDLTEPEVEDVIDEETGETIAYPKENFDFILELDTANNAANAGDLTFTTTRGQVMTHKTPDEPAEEQVAFMKLKYQAVEDALYGDDLATLATLVDINDFARAYLINEVAKNLDAGVTSCYFVYDSAEGIFYMSPVWDYDNALGNSVSIAERHDAAGKMLDLTQPSGWYAKELMHFDAGFQGGRSVFSQACYMTSKTADDKSFMDIVKDIWATDFADTAAVLAGEADAANGRLMSAQGYLGSLAKSGNWNYAHGGWQLSNNTNNTWISNHSALTMYNFDAEAGTITSTTKKYDQTKFADQAQYASDWMLSRINWISAQFADAKEAVAEGYTRVYFENNWNWSNPTVYYWGSAAVATPAWPGDALTKVVGANDEGYTIYEVIIPSDVTGFLFAGTGGYGDDQSEDITTIAEGYCYYMTYVADTDKKVAESYAYNVPTPDVPASSAAASSAPASSAPASSTPAASTPASSAAASSEAVKEEYITVYFSNAWAWKDVRVHTFGSKFAADTEWPGAAMTLLYVNDYDQEVYSAKIAADVTGIVFTGIDGETLKKSADIVPKDGYGYYMDWSEEEGEHTDEYVYVAPTDPETSSSAAASSAAASSAAASSAPAASTPASSAAASDPTTPVVTTATVYAINSTKWDVVCAYVWGGVDGNTWPGTAMQKTGETVNGFDVYAFTFDASNTKVIFDNNDKGGQTDDLKVENGKYFDIKAGKWYASLADVPAIDPLGTDVYILGGFNNWSTTANEFKKAEVGAATATVTIELEANTTYEFKVIREGAWTSNTTAITGTVAGLTFSSSVEGNAKITTTDAGTYTFTWTIAASQLTVTYPGTETPEIPTPDEPKPDTTVKVAGSFTKWAEGALEMTADETGKIYTISDVRLEKGKYEFKIVEFGVWYGNSGTIENVTEGEGWTFKDKDAEGNDVVNCTLNTKGGVYTFIFNTETNKLQVVAVLDKLVYDVTWNEGNFTVNAPASIDEATDLTFTIDAADGYKVTAVIVDMKVIEAVDGVYTIANVQGDINMLIITAEDVTVPEVMKFEVTFVDKDGTTLKTETVEYGQAATAPEAPVVEGYTFKGWDTAFDYVTKNITVKATYKKNAAPVVPATTTTLKVEVTGGNGFTVAVNGGAARPQGASYTNTKMPIGATVTLVAPAIDGQEFLGWYNPINNIAYTLSNTYTFTATGEVFVKAMYATKVEGVQLVIFKNDKAAGGNGHILDMQYYASTDTIDFPAGATQVGYDFTGWNMTEAEIQAAIAAGKDVTVLAKWTRQIVYVNVTVDGGTGGGKVVANSATTVKANAAESGMKFAYWVDAAGNIRSYNAEYKFFPSADVALTAVFVAEDTAIEYEILVSVDSCDMSTTSNIFTYSWYVHEDENVTFVDAGILAINKDFYDEDKFYIGSGLANMYDRGPSAAKDMIPVHTYSWTKSNVPSGQIWMAKAYVQYKDATGTVHTVYSDVKEFVRE